MKMSLRIPKMLTHYHSVSMYQWHHTYKQIEGKRTIYFLRDTTLVNGRPSWYSTHSTNDYDLEHQSYAIWFDIKHNSWMFGTSKYRGKSRGFVYATQDSICPSQKDMIFKYYGRNDLLLSSLYDDYGIKKWMIATSDLVSLDCLKYY